MVVGMAQHGPSQAHLGARGKEMGTKGCIKNTCVNGHEIAGDNLAIVCGRRRCRTCWKTYQKKAKLKLRQENPTHEVDLEYRRLYNITLAQYELMVEAQGGLCKICGNKNPEGLKRWHIDHDHKCCPRKRGCCGKCIRGLLCVTCNLALGAAKDSPELLQKMIDYLKEHSNG